MVPNFVIQGGDPRGDGSGGPGYFIRCEYSETPFDKGTVGIATSGKDTGGSQFFITLSPQPHLNARYTAFGQVRPGWRWPSRSSAGTLSSRLRFRKGNHETDCVTDHLAFAADHVTSKSGPAPEGMDPEALINRILTVDSEQRSQIKDVIYDAEYVENEAGTTASPRRRSG